MGAPADHTSQESQVLPVPTSGVSRAATQEPDEKKDVSVDWFDLPVLAKLDSMHLVTEWQFQNPTRLRMLMRSDDELATWVFVN